MREQHGVGAERVGQGDGEHEARIYHPPDAGAPSPQSVAAGPRRASARSATWPTSPPRWSPSSPSGSASRCSSRARPESARPSSRRRSRAPPAASWCACSATRASTRPRRCTSGTTASSCCGSRPRLGRRRRRGAWDVARGDIFTEEFLLTRPLLQAIAAEEPVVLLIDEIDKTDQEFEAMLLEVLSDFQISIPELGVIEATDAPDRAAHLEQLARADRGAEAPLPLPLARLPGRSSARSRSSACTRRSSTRRWRGGWSRSIHMVRAARPEEAALDRRVDRLGAHAAADGRRRHRPRDLRAAR